MKTILKKVGAFFSGITDRLISVIGALGMAQFPQFFSQYLQRLGGHLQEARRTIDMYQQAAESLGISFEEYISRHLQAEEQVFQTSGEVISNLVSRLETLEVSFANLQQAGPFTRWLVFSQEVDWDIARQTFYFFTPGFPTSIEGIIYALTGLILGWGVFGLFKKAFFTLDKKIRKKKNSQKSI